MHATIFLALLPYVIAAPIITPRGSAIIPGKYIVKMKAGASKANFDAAKALLANSPQYEYGFGGFTGFAGKISDATVTKLQKLDAVCDLSLVQSTKLTDF
jgi:hypothetical protein